MSWAYCAPKSTTRTVSKLSAVTWGGLPAYDGWCRVYGPRPRRPARRSRQAVTDRPKSGRSSTGRPLLSTRAPPPLRRPGPARPQVTGPVPAVDRVAAVALARGRHGLRRHLDGRAGARPRRDRPWARRGGLRSRPGRRRPVVAGRARPRPRAGGGGRAAPP